MPRSTLPNSNNRLTPPSRINFSGSADESGVNLENFQKVKGGGLNIGENNDMIDDIRYVYIVNLNKYKQIALIV